MARIRTIKPEFPQSESMGRVSREARLTFILLWTLADDAGRLRGNPRLLASLLYPYDTDAPALMDGWLVELERENCIRRYAADGATYVAIVNWNTHQKIDRPSKGRFNPPPLTCADGQNQPEMSPREGDTAEKYGPREESHNGAAPLASLREEGEDVGEIARNSLTDALANPRENSSLDQGPRTKDQRTKDHLSSTRKPRAKSTPPTLEQVQAYCAERHNDIDPEEFLAFYQANGWVQGKGKPVKDWRACVITWEKARRKSRPASRVPTDEDLANWNPVDGGLGAIGGGNG